MFEKAREYCILVEIQCPYFEYGVRLNEFEFKDTAKFKVCTFLIQYKIKTCGLQIKH